MPEKPSLKSTFGKSLVIPGFLEKAIALHEDGNLQQAARIYQHILDHSPEHFDATNLLAVVNAQVGQFIEARALFVRALTLRPGHAEAHFNKGTMERADGKLEAALADFSLAIRAVPYHLGALNNRSLVLQDMRRFEEALLDSDRLIGLMPNDPTFQNNRGALLHDMMRLNEAMACLDEAIRLKPEYVEALDNRGNLLTDMHKIDEALANYDSAIAINPNYTRAPFHKSTALLLKGDLATGWPLWEWRWRQPRVTSPVRDFEKPLWVGDTNIGGKTILLHSEQGLGDSVQFVRYAPMVAKLGARVVLEVPEQVRPLLATMNGVDQLIGKDDELPAFDYHCPLMSLPLAFKTTLETIPTSTPYLMISPSRLAEWSQRLDTSSRPCVALAWRGSPNNTNNHIRSTRLEDIAPHLSPEFDWLCLHHDLDKPERQLVKSLPHLNAPLDKDTNLEDAAAVCALSDVVVSVDTIFAHIAGALGKTSLVMLPFTPDWRWMLDRADSPWYPTMTLFRQDQNRSWSEVIVDVVAALEKATQ